MRLARVALPGSLLLVCVCACAATPRPPASGPSASTDASRLLLPEERHLADLRQLTFGGENAEAYWAFEGGRLSLQARREGEGCDRIQVLDGALGPGAPSIRQVSSGRGATTCAHFLPGGDELIYASTHLGGDACPPRPDMSLGYVWALYDSYDIFKARADGSGELVRLTETPGYDAEGTVCGRDGSIVFTSVRDGDIDLYRMDRDGRNVKRLTDTPGYDGGAFFSADCTKIVWRASRPRPGKEQGDYKALLGRGLVRPTKLELYVANADGSDARQITYLDAASFAPFFFPDGKRVLFSSNVGDPKRRDFDLWAVNVDGTGLERITHAKGFDGFPMLSPDGAWLAFSSNRATAEGRSDTNLFVARFVGGASSGAAREESAADRIARDAAWLAAPEREGRGVGTRGLEAAGAFIEERWKALGLEPAATGGGYREAFEVRTGAKVGAGTRLAIEGKAVAADAFRPLGWSGPGSATGRLVLAGHGIVDEEAKLDDYRGLDVKGKIVVVRRFAPEGPETSGWSAEKKRRLGDLRRKAFVAKGRGAVGLLVVDWPVVAAKPVDGAGAKGAGSDAKAGPAELPAEAALPSLTVEGAGDAGIPVLAVRRAALSSAWPKLEKRAPVAATLGVELFIETAPAFNVVGRLRATAGVAAGSAGGPVTIIGAHYDHLGFGGPDSLAPDKHEPHLGADDNGSGTVTLLEIARRLAERRDALARDVVLVAFSGEESGVIGSAAAVRAHPEWLKPGSVMLNMDMVGRLRENKLSVLGVESAEGFGPLVEEACAAARVGCAASGDGYGPSDHMPFYTAGLPVLHFFTGAHGDYHKPSDSADKLNAAGMARVAEVVLGVTERLPGATLTYRKVPMPVRGDARSFNASLGTVPDYGGPPKGVRGVLLADVRPGGGAERGGMRRGDVLVRLGQTDIGSVEDLMFVLTAAKPGQTVTAVVLRDGKEVKLEVTFQEGRRR